ncbi:hypothetical protein B0O99DRAFT_594180 [Bisporella sp. PMI_857]|nr:hypothetical protein B0O99DRAFT_594180 [Bisporella sp. PMI_857]
MTALLRRPPLSKPRSETENYRYREEDIRFCITHPQINWISCRFSWNMKLWAVKNGIRVLKITYRTIEAHNRKDDEREPSVNGVQTVVIVPIVTARHSPSNFLHSQQVKETILERRRTEMRLILAMMPFHFDMELVDENENWTNQ